MNILKIVTIGFLILEAANVITLYFFPGSKYANGVGVFKAWEKSKSDPEMHRFIKYLINWVAGTKLIFILLLIVILYTADDESLVLMGMALAISIASFFWRLFLLIREMDRNNEITPKHYSVILGGMIIAFVSVFLVATIVTIASF
jgi:hypothetical protein